MVVYLSLVAFCLWMLVDCVTYPLRDLNDVNAKIGWVLFIIVLPPIGAALYFFTARRRRKAEGR